MVAGRTEFEPVEPQHRGANGGEANGTIPAVSIVVPTYEEADNLPHLVRRLDEALADLPGGYEVIVVDDDSPDGTADVGRTLAAMYPVHVVHRKDRSGLSTAVVDGFDAARADRLLVMDADLQHPPERVPDLVASLQDGADLAIGSRHVDGGSMGSFGPLRRAISHGADVLARTLLPPARDVADIQSGFFALDRSVVADADLDPTGYKILLEILIQGHADRVVEVGYRFGERERGDSNLGVGSILDYLHHLASLVRRRGEHRRIGRFLAVGALGALVNLALLTVLLRVGSPSLLASGLAIEAGLLGNFALNHRWTFRDRAPTDRDRLVAALGRDHAVRGGGMVLNLAIFAVLTLAGRSPIVSQAIGVAAATGWNYAGNTWWTWTGREQGGLDPDQPEKPPVPSSEATERTPGPGGDFKPGAVRGSGRDRPLARLRERAGDPDDGLGSRS